MLVADIEDPLHIRAGWAGKLGGSAGKKVLESRREREDPDPTLGRPHVSKSMRASFWQIDGTARPHFRPIPFRQKANLPIGNQEQLIFLRMDMGRGAAARRGDVKHQGQLASGLIATQQNR